MFKIIIVTIVAFSNCYSAEYTFATRDVSDEVKSEILKRVQTCIKSNKSELNSAKISKSQESNIMIWTFQCKSDFDFNNIVNFIKNNVNIPVVRIENIKHSDSEIEKQLSVVKMRD